MKYMENAQLTPLVETGALIANYAALDDRVNALYFHTTGLHDADVTVEYHGDGPQIARNILTIVRNNYPQVCIRLFSTRTQEGQDLMEKSHCLYKHQPPKKKAVTAAGKKSA